MADVEFDVNVNETDAIFPEVDTDIDVPVTVGEDGFSVLASSIDSNDVDIDADVEPGELVDVDVTESTGGGTSDHRFLTHRDAPNQHPMSAITGLTERLQSIESTFDTRLLTAENGIVSLVMGQEQLVIDVGQAQADAAAAGTAAIAAGTSAEVAQRAADAAIEANYKKYNEVTWTDAEILQKCTHGKELTIPRHVPQTGETEYYYLGDVRKGDIIVVNVKKSDHDNDMAKLLIEADDDYEQGEAVTGEVVSWDDNILAHFWSDSAGAHVSSVGGYRADLDGTGVKFFDNLGTQRALFGTNGFVIGNPNGERFVQTATALQAYDANGKFFEVTRSGMSYGNGTFVATAQSVVDAENNAKDYTDLQLVGPMRFISAVGAVDSEGEYTLIDGGKIKTGTLTASVITTGTLDASKVTVTNLSASSITTGNFSADRIQGGTLILGGRNNGNGQLQVLNANGSEVARISNAGLTINSGSIGGLTITGSSLYTGTHSSLESFAAGTYFGSDGISFGSGSAYCLLGGWDKTYQLATFKQISSQVAALVFGVKSSGMELYGTATINGTVNCTNVTCGSVSASTQVQSDLLKTTDEGQVQLRGKNGAYINNLSCSSDGHFTCASIYNRSASSGGTAVRVNDDGHLFRYTSARRFKKDIKDVEDFDLTALYDVPVRQYKYKEGAIPKSDPYYNRDIVGLIAEEVGEALPVACIRNSDGDAVDWDERYVLVGLLKLVQEQNERIKALERSI